MSDKQCPFCGSTEYETRETDYLYSKEEQYLLVKKFPVEICCNCGMVYYNGRLLEEVERTFIAIHEQQRQPDSQVLVPVTVCA
jgi:YgiT-type zinc finger domain-containing protein